MKIKSLFRLVTIALAGALVLGACQPKTVIVQQEKVAKETVVVEVEKKPVVTKEPTVEHTPVGGKDIQEPIPITVHDFGYGGKPELCDFASPMVAPLAVDSAQYKDSTLVDKSVALVVSYENEKGQTFWITVHSMGDEAALEYIKEIRVCFEAIQVGPPSGIEAVSVSPENVLRDAIIDNVGLSLEELFTQRTEYLEASKAAGEIPSLAGLLKTLDFDAEEAFSHFVERAEEAVVNAVDQGLLTEEEANDLSPRLAPILKDALFSNEQLSILDHEILDVKNDYFQDLSENPENIVVEVEWADEPQGSAKEYSIFFVIDPPTVGQYKSHWYNWKSNTYVDASLWASTGEPGTYLYQWDNGYKYLTGASKKATGYSLWVSASSSTEEWYRLRVYGWDTSNAYYLYGSWEGESYSDEP